MDKLFDYINWRGDLTFEQVPFNDLDAAVFARFCYEPMEKIVSEGYSQKISMSDVCRNLLNLPELSEYLLNYDLDKKLIIALSEADRYKNVMICGHVNEISVDNETQFSATTYEYEECMYYVAFRGTDTTLVAWKENFNMGFEFPVLAQEKAKDYLEKTMRNLKDGSFVVGGHSKGGNLAIYSSVFCGSAFKQSITKIYSFDGPGFTESIIHTEEYLSVADRIITFVPGFSIVGMILEHEDDYSVVEAEGAPLAQHDLLSWGVTNKGFRVKELIHAGSKIIDGTLKNMMSELSRDEREEFVNNVYNVIINEDVSTLDDIEKNPAQLVMRAFKTYNALDKNAKQGMKDTFKTLFKSLGTTLSGDNKE